MFKTGTAICNKFVSVHRFIILQKADKVKPLAGLLVKLNCYYATEAAIVGVPQLALK
jgi:hypothetical protein